MKSAADGGLDFILGALAVGRASQPSSRLSLAALYKDKNLTIFGEVCHIHFGDFSEVI